MNAVDADMSEDVLAEIKADFILEDFAVDTECFIAYDKTPTSNGYTRKSEVDAVQICFDNGKVLLLDKNKIIQTYDDTTEKVKELNAGKLKRGMRLILVENSTKKSLLKSLLSKIENHPKMQETITYQRQWNERLCEDVVDARDSAAKVLKKLKEHGALSPNNYIAIYTWMNGMVLGPRDDENIRRIGEIYDDEYLLDHWKNIARALKRLRTMHRSFAKKLNKLIPKAGVEYDVKDTESSVIDEELELYLEDFANIISLETIAEIKNVGLVPVSSLDRVTLGE